MLSFKASLVDTVNIKKIYPNKTTTDYPSHFVELDTLCYEDYKAIRTIARSWEKVASFAGDLFDRFVVDRSILPQKEKPKYRYFALTKSDEPFENVNADNILGVASVTKEKDDSFTLSQLQVDPEHQYGSQRREFKHIGQALVESIIKILPKKEVSLYAATRDAEIFYEKLNFVQKPNSIFMHLKR